jgi:hypothetical protein
MKEIFDSVLKTAQPIDQEQPESRIILEMILRIIIAFDAAGSGIMISYGSSFGSGQRILMLIGEKWIEVAEEDFKVFLLDFADRSDITCVATFELAYNCLHRISPPQQCHSWPSMVHSARVTMRKRNESFSG